MLSEKTRKIVSRILIWGGLGFLALIILLYFSGSAAPVNGVCQRGSLNPQTSMCEIVRKGTLQLFLFIFGGIGAVYLALKYFKTREGSLWIFKKTKPPRLTQVEAAQAIKNFYLQQMGKHVKEIHPKTPSFPNLKQGEEKIQWFEVILDDLNILSVKVSLDRGVYAIEQGDMAIWDDHPLSYTRIADSRFSPQQVQDRDPIDRLIELGPEGVELARKIAVQRLANQGEKKENESAEEKQ